MNVSVMALMATFVCASAARAQALVACVCDEHTVCLSKVQMARHTVHVEMEPDRMGNHANYSGVAVFQIGFDEQGRVTGATAISGQPLAISHLLAAVFKWRFKPVIVKGKEKKGCGKLVIKFAIKNNLPFADVAGTR